MASAGSLQIDVLANTQKLVAGMKRAESVTAKAAQNMSNAVKGFAAIFVSGRLISAISSSSDAIDKLGKTSSKLGVGTKELGALHYAAEQSGVSVETLNMALQRSTRRIAEAAQGTGEAVKALDELGLSAEELNKLSPDEQLYEIADAMAKVTNQSDKVRLSMKLFDSEGVALVNMLGSGSSAMREYAVEAASLGILLESSMVKKVEAANDASNRFSKALSVAATTIDVQLAPYIIHASNVLVELIKRFRDSGEGSTIFADIMSGVSRVFVVAFNAMQVIVDGFMTSWMALLVVVEAGKELFNFEDANTMEAFVRFREQADLTKNSLSELSSSITGTDQVTLNLVDSLNKINAQFVTTSQTAPQALKKVKVATDDIKESISLMEDASTTFGNGMASSFRQSLDGATNFKDMFGNVAKDIIAQLFKILVVQEAVNAAMGSFSSSARPSGVSGPMQQNGSFADGGVTQRGGSFLVGERGAEMVTLPKNSSVASNADLSSAGKTVVNVYNYSSSEVKTETDINGQINIIVDKISNDLNRGVSPINSSMENMYGLSKV